MQKGSTPFVKLLIPFIAGIAFYDRIDSAVLNTAFLLALGILLLSFSFILFKLIPTPSFRYRWLTGSIIITLFFLSGYLRYSLPDSSTNAGHYSSNLFNGSAHVSAIAVISETPRRKERSFSAPVNVIVAQSDISFKKVGEKVMVYFAIDTMVQQIARNDTIVFTSIISSIKNSGNPASFDYETFMRRKGIKYTTYLPSKSWKLIGSTSRGNVLSYFEKSRTSIYDRIFSSSLSDNNKGLALALLIGIKDDLDPEVSKSFSSAGAVHVLCVSGLHVGIIFMLISTLFGKFKSIPRWGKPLFAITGILSIWSYAIITGLPPSVTRASLMFSMMIFAKLAERTNISINSVAASAFIILMLEPATLFHLGFQLSYLAVTGIITLFKPISSVWNPKLIILQKIRDLMTVAVCAQLFTFPLAVSTFNIFPNFFLLTNILIIPITGFVIYSGIAFIINPIPQIDIFFQYLFDFLLSTMRGMVNFVESIPGSVSEGIYISKEQTWLLLFIVFLIMIIIKFANRRAIFICLISVLAFVAIEGIISIRSSKAQHVVVYNSRNSTLIDFIINRKRFTLVSSELSDNDINFTAGMFRAKAGVYNNSEVIGELTVKERHIIKVKHPLAGVIFINANIEEPDTFNYEIAIISGNVRPNKNIFKMIRADIYVLDGSVKRWQQDQWELFATNYNKKIWKTSERGAYHKYVNYSE